jgi:hypothetical protein
MPPAKKQSPPRFSANKTDFELGQQIAELKGNVDTGFKGVNQRLDFLNGRVGKHDELFGKILGDEKYQAGIRKGVSTFWAVVVTILGIALGAISAYFGFKQYLIQKYQFRQEQAIQSSTSN